ncbi:MAG: DUF58 domain-containing protein [Elusimicrobiaceae bacterium]|nr:DUF58 domain-containing protein [Elusimicrobiaceae bacterium]
MDTAEILKRVRRIEIETGKLVKETFAGEYLSIFKGQGIEFAEVRQYIPGDDVRSIDWNVSAKTGSVFVKKFNEERELTLLIACDVSASLMFGSLGRLKSEIAAELAAVFAFSATHNNDKVGLLLFSDKIELYIPPKKGRRHVLRIIRELLAFTPQNKGTDMVLALDSINHLTRRGGIVVLISDFKTEQNYAKSFKLTARKFDVVPVVVEDQLEQRLPKAHIFLSLEGLEGGGQVLLNLASKKTSEITRRNMQKLDEAKLLFTKSSLEYVIIHDGDKVSDTLIKFFKRRARKLRR